MLSVWRSSAQSETNNWNYLHIFDKLHVLQHDPMVTDARVTWSDPERLAD
jgi:hypothetical protein